MMANKRMFSVDVVETDAFLDLPPKVQALYFHLGMNGADINREKAKAGQQTDKEVQRLRESCITLLELLDDPKAVRGILLYASRLYSRQERRKSQEGQQ